MDEIEIDIELRPPDEVAARCVILAALLRRLWLETGATSAPGDEPAGEAFDLRGWLQAEGLWDRLTDFDAELLNRPIGSLDDEDIANVTWQAEALATLAWSLNFVNDLPAGGQGDIETIVKALPAPWEQTSPWLQGARLRAEPEIARERERAEVYAWRIEVEPVRRAADSAERAAIKATIAAVTREATAAGLIENAGGNDFSIDGQPVHTFDEGELERSAALAGERLRALNWVCGFGDSWDQVPLEV